MPYVGHTKLPTLFKPHHEVLSNEPAKSQDSYIEWLLKVDSFIADAKFRQLLAEQEDKAEQLGLEESLARLNKQSKQKAKANKAKAKRASKKRRAYKAKSFVNTFVWSDEVKTNGIQHSRLSNDAWINSLITLQNGLANDKLARFKNKSLVHEWVTSLIPKDKSKDIKADLDIVSDGLVERVQRSMKELKSYSTLAPTLEYLEECLLVGEFDINRLYLTLKDDLKHTTEFNREFNQCVSYVNMSISWDLEVVRQLLMRILKHFLKTGSTIEGYALVKSPKEMYILETLINHGYIRYENKGKIPHYAIMPDYIPNESELAKMLKEQLDFDYKPNTYAKQHRNIKSVPKLGVTFLDSRIGKREPLVRAINKLNRTKLKLHSSYFEGDGIELHHSQLMEAYRDVADKVFYAKFSNYFGGLLDSLEDTYFYPNYGYDFSNRLYDGNQVTSITNQKPLRAFLCVDPYELTKNGYKSVYSYLYTKLFKTIISINKISALQIEEVDKAIEDLDPYSLYMDEPNEWKRLGKQTLVARAIDAIRTGKSDMLVGNDGLNQGTGIIACLTGDKPLHLLSGLGINPNISAYGVFGEHISTMLEAWVSRHPECYTSPNKHCLKDSLGNLTCNANIKYKLMAVPYNQSVKGAVEGKQEFRNLGALEKEDKLATMSQKEKPFLYLLKENGFELDPKVASSLYKQAVDRVSPTYYKFGKMLTNVVKANPDVTAYFVNHPDGVSSQINRLESYEITHKILTSNGGTRQITLYVKYNSNKSERDTQISPLLIQGIDGYLMRHVLNQVHYPCLGVHDDYMVGFNHCVPVRKVYGNIYNWLALSDHYQKEYEKLTLGKSYYTFRDIPDKSIDVLDELTEFPYCMTF